MTATKINIWPSRWTRWVAGAERVIRTTWHAEVLYDDGSSKECGHHHRTTDVAIACGKKMVKS